MTVLHLDKRIAVICTAGAAACFILGIIIGHFATGSGGTEENRVERMARDVHHKELVKEVMDTMDPTSIREFLENLSKEPHIAASDRDSYLTQWLKNSWEEFGLDSVSLSTYEYLLSYPNAANPNKVFLYDQDNQQQFVSKHEEDVLRKEDAHENFIHAFNAYAPAGDVSGELVYVNYGRIEDIQRLEELGVSLKGRIALSRYGKIFRGNRLKNCQDAGAIGVIMFSDPADVAVNGVEPEDVYPNTFFLPPSGVQRGSTFIGSGDPLSPSWPSVPGAYRQKYNETEGLPKIPSQPIGYGDAQKLLEVMGGERVPEDWEGKVPGVTYKLGPGFSENHQGWKVRLVVNNVFEEKEDSSVLGLIRGSEEPDRYVLISNHRDAWGYGAIDPSSGTCAMMEVARVLGNLVKTGKWRPRRSILFASWSTEEYGLMGSNEWVYDKIHKLMNKAVALINVDICVKGPILDPEASPILKEVFIAALKEVPFNGDQSKSYYEFYKEYLKNEAKPIYNVEDKIKIMGSGSDQAAFAFYAGVPALKFDFEIDRQQYPGFSSYPMYHTGYETFYLMDKIIDPGFAIHKTCSQISSHMALNLAESLVLPFTTRHLLAELQKGIDALEKNNVPKALKENGAGEAYDLMLKSLNTFKMAAEKWTEGKSQMESDGTLSNPIRLRELNDQIMNLERTFLLPKGLPGRPEIRNALFSPAKFNAYGGAAFPGISDLLFDWEKLAKDERITRFEEVKRHLSDLMLIFRQAASWLSLEYDI